jgi:hypothetical protein
LKTCLKNIDAGMPFPGRREDFESEEAWNSWRRLERLRLSQLMVAMIKFKPELARSNPSDNYSPPGMTHGRTMSTYSVGSTSTKHSSIGNRQSVFLVGSDRNDYQNSDVYDEDDEIQVGHNFTYIPPNPKRFYKRLLEYCLVSDLEIMLSPEVDDNDEVSLGILSQASVELINECALRWGIGQPYRAACFLDLVRSFYERHDVPMECVPEALQGTIKCILELELSKWPSADVSVAVLANTNSLISIRQIDFLSTVYANVFTMFLSEVYHAMDSVPNVKPSVLDPPLGVLKTLQSTGLLLRTNLDIPASLADVETQVRKASARVYATKLEELQAAPGVNRALPLLLLTDEIEKHAKLLDKRFPEPLLG